MIVRLLPLNNRAISFIKNFSYSFTTNMISMLISALVILIIPKVIGVEEYGYWQLYLFYTSYVGFLHFGWNDGIYLRYGGKEYKELDKQLFFSQFNMLVSFQTILLVIIVSASYFLIVDDNRAFIIEMTAICMLITNSLYMLLYVLQATSRIKEYAQITMLDRILYVCIILLFLIFGVKNFKLLIIADLFGKFIALLYAMYCCKEIVFNKISTLHFSFREVKKNLSVGIKLLLANIASILIIGVARFGIERTWGVVVFGKVSLTLSISNFLMLFVNAIGLVMFPVLRRTDKEKLPSIYSVLRDSLMVIILGGMILYFPIKVILTAWLPEYADSLTYMAILFPMVIYEGKMSLLVNTYFKTLRREKLMLKVNIISLMLSLTLSLISTIWFKNLNLAILSIIFVLAFRSILGEICLSNILGRRFYKDIILETIVVFAFLITGWYINLWISIGIYGIVYITYLLLKYKDIKRSIQSIKVILKAN